MATPEASVPVSPTRLDRYDEWLLDNAVLLETREGQVGELDWSADPCWRGRAAKWERMARDRPRRYRARVVLAALAGYIFLLCLAGIAIAALLVLVVAVPTFYFSHGDIYVPPIYWVLPLLAISGKTVTSLHVGRSLPAGAVFQRATAPALFDLLD